MNRKYLSLLPLLLATLCITTVSCLSDEDTASTANYNDCIITSMTLGTLNRDVPLKTRDGRDSSYRVSVTGALYPLSIDQVNRRIFNNDSLPLGTDISSVTFSGLSATGITAIRSLTTEKDTTFALADSTDFTTPRLLTVYAYDGVSSKTYTVQFNVHKEAPDTFKWHKVCTADPQLQGLQGRHHLLSRTDGTLIVYGYQGGKPVALSAKLPEEWSKTELPEGFSTASVQQNPDRTAYYALSTEGLLQSQDGLTWTSTGATNSPDFLLAAGKTVLSGLKDGLFVSSTDGGITWNTDDADDPEYIPVSEAAGTRVQSRTDDKMEDFVVVGRSAEGKPVVWRRTIDLTGTNTFNWYYLPDVAEAHLRCPALSETSVVSYDEGTVLAGRTAEGGAAPLYMSRDNGRTWNAKTLKQPGLPAGNDRHVSVTTDTDNFIYLLESTSGTLLKGRYNRMGWQENTGIFNRSKKR